MADRRQVRRWYLVLYLRVFDADTGEQLGHLVEISQKGLMVVSDLPFPLEREFHLSLDVPHPDGTRERLHLNARSLWTSADANPDFHDTGFELVQVNQYRVDRIRTLVEELSFK